MYEPDYTCWFINHIFYSLTQVLNFYCFYGVNNYIIKIFG